MVQVSYPGVYVQELPSGVRTIVGVSTSIGMFIGRAAQGELFRPIRCLSFSDFERAFSTAWAKSDLARSVKLFFDNGGSECFVMRIADGAQPAKVQLRDEALTPTLEIEAKSPGLFGNDIRVSVNYNTPSPEATFNLEVFRYSKGSNGALQQTQLESHSNLSMDKDDPRYAQDIIRSASKLITVNDPRNAVALAGNGISISGFPVSSRTNAIFQTQFQALITATQNKIGLSVGGHSPLTIDLSSLVGAVPATPAATATLLQTTINSQLQPGAAVTVSFDAGPTGPAGQDNATTVLLRIQSAGADVYVTPAPGADLAGPLMLGTAQGGIEVPRSANRRPVPNGVVTRADFTVAANGLTNFAQVTQASVNAVRVAGVRIPLEGGNALQTSSGAVNGPRVYQDQTATTQNDGRRGVTEKLARIASAINNMRASDPANFKWRAEVWGTRLAVLAAGDVGDLTTTTLEAGFIPAGPPPQPFNPAVNVFDIAAQPLAQNVRYYVLGAPPAPPTAFYTAGVVGNDGNKPKLKEYEDAYTVIDRQVDLFNLMVLPRDHEHSDTEMRNLWGPASNFCQRKRAFLLIDPPQLPPGGWKDHNDAVDVSIGVNSLRIGLSKQYSAVYFPDLLIRDGAKEERVGPAGAIAGLMARIDGTRGVWKAAAGVEADIRGVVGVNRRFSDAENGVMNPRAVNTIRVFPTGIVAWGARTMDGDDTFGSEYKYSCVRRLANFIEESLYRGLNWAVFEPNDEPLWGQIRLNVGAFMHNLFRQGAFQGATPREAYFVRCDSSTTTQNDINLGIVNVIVGFAPLKPAEFVVLYVVQIAGQIQT